jgi:NADPH:quinone reductase-like Zn-dependent oxidoreductase
MSIVTTAIKCTHGDQRVLDAAVTRPVMDRISPFAWTNEAIAYVEAGRAKGKVVVKVR